MIKYRQIIWVLPILFIISCSGHKVVEETNEEKGIFDAQLDAPSSTLFTLGPGDEITINVWRNDDLKRTIKIDPSGNIYVPLAGEIQASGLTLFELREKIALKLSKYIIDPQVDISIVVITSQKFIVLGEVESAGSFTLNQKVLALEGIARAGGFTDNANQKNVLLVRADKDIARVSALNLNIKGMDKDGELDLKVYLQNGDIIYVLPSFIANIEQFMLRLNNILKPFLTTAQTIWFGDRAIDVIVNTDSN